MMQQGGRIHIIKNKRLKSGSRFQTDDFLGALRKTFSDFQLYILYFGGGEDQGVDVWCVGAGGCGLGCGCGWGDGREYTVLTATLLRS